MEKLDEYREAALALALERADVRLPNRSIEHAKILVETMILNTRSDEEIYIYSGDLPEDVYGPWLRGAQAQRISILVDDDSGLGWLEPLRERRGSSFSAKRISKPRSNHFLCTSGGFFRFETDTNSYEAEASFNEPEVADHLIDAHNRYASD